MDVVRGWWYSWQHSWCWLLHWAGSSEEWARRRPTRLDGDCLAFEHGPAIQPQAQSHRLTAISPCTDTDQRPETRDQGPSHQPRWCFAIVDRWLDGTKGQWSIQSPMVAIGMDCPGYFCSAIFGGGSSFIFAIGIFALDCIGLHWTCWFVSIYICIFIFISPSSPVSSSLVLAAAFTRPSAQPLPSLVRVWNGRVEWPCGEHPFEL